MSRSVISRSASRLERTVASASAVASGSVARRQCSTSSWPSNLPMCVWVLPTPVARSTGGCLTDGLAEYQRRRHLERALGGVKGQAERLLGVERYRAPVPAGE